MFGEVPLEPRGPEPPTRVFNAPGSEWIKNAQGMWELKSHLLPENEFGLVTITPAQSYVLYGDFLHVSALDAVCDKNAIDPSKHMMVPTDLLFRCLALVAQDPMATPQGLAIGLGVRRMPMAKEDRDLVLPNGINPDQTTEGMSMRKCTEMPTRERLRTWLGEIYCKRVSIEHMNLFLDEQSATRTDLWACDWLLNELLNPLVRMAGDLGENKILYKRFVSRCLRVHNLWQYSEGYRLPRPGVTIHTPPLAGKVFENQMRIARRMEKCFLRYKTFVGP